MHEIRYEDIRELAKIASENNVEITLTADKEGLSVAVETRIADAPSVVPSEGCASREYDDTKSVWENIRAGNGISKEIPKEPSEDLISRTEAFEVLTASDYFWLRPSEKEAEALNMAIEALEEKYPCDLCKHYEDDDWGVCQYCPAERK